MNESKIAPMNEVMQHMKVVLPMIQHIFPLDVSFAVTDREKFLYYLPGKEIDHKISANTPLPQAAGFRRVLEAREVIHANVPKHVYGVLFKSSSMPILDNDGAIIGVLTMGISLKNQEVLGLAAQSLASTSEEITATTEEIASVAVGLDNMIKDLRIIGKNVVQELHRTDTILDFIRNVAVNSNLLGLNAAIEAARAAEYGRGFSVVADEIRKMAVTSASSAQDISKILVNIRNSVNTIVERLELCSEESQHQAAATEQISSAIQQLASSANKIEQISQLI